GCVRKCGRGLRSLVVDEYRARTGGRFRGLGRGGRAPASPRTPSPSPLAGEGDEPPKRSEGGEAGEGDAGVDAKVPSPRSPRSNPGEPPSPPMGEGTSAPLARTPTLSNICCAGGDRPSLDRS